LHGDWSIEASGFSTDDPEIAALSAEFRTRAAQARAPTTLSTYSGPWSKFKSWCLEHGVSFLPAKPLTVALYLTKLMRTASSPSPILSCSGAIFLHHHLAGLPSPTSHPLVTMAREISRRTKVAGQNQKKPLLASHIRRLFGLWLFAPASTLFDLMRLVAISTSYAGFLRYSDLMAVRWEEIMFFPTHMELFLEKSKTDQYREGRWVLISRVSGQYCPVALVELLLKIGRYAELGPGSLIRNTTVTPSKQYIRSEVPSYNTVLGWYKDAARALGLDPDAYGTHSARRGGATRAANVDVPDRLFKEHGAWRSERAKDGYVVSSLQARLSVTASLGFQDDVTLAELVEFERAARF
jgi:integrase